MGWSCGYMAAFRMDAITDACVKQTGSSNIFQVGDKRYMIEWSRREHRDGAITGTIYRFVDETRAIKSGSIRIEGDGTITRAPKFCKDIPAHVLIVDGVQRGRWREGEPTEDSLRAYIKGKYMEQYMPGGINRHIAVSSGRMPYPTIANVVNIQTGKTVMWEAHMFECW